MANRPVTADDKLAMLTDMQSGLTRTQISKKHIRSGQTVSAVAKELGFEWAGPRDEATALKLKVANEVYAANTAERRAELVAKALRVADRLLEDISGPVTVFHFGGKDNEYNERQLDRAPAETVAKALQGYRYALQTAVEVARFDATGSDSGSAVDEWLKNLTEHGTSKPVEPVDDE